MPIAVFLDFVCKMPRGKYIRKNKRNENDLTTRLMQISLAMDDHIYSGQLISTSEAAAYLQEIATLKLRCLPNNIRALQVIEKLTRCMRSILAEDTGDSFHKSLQMYSEEVGSASPVYSLPDIDRTYTQNGIENVIHIYNSEDEEPIKQNIGTHLSFDHINMAKDFDQQSYLTTLPKAHNVSEPKSTSDDYEIIDITNASDADETQDIDTGSKQQNVVIENINTKILNTLLDITNASENHKSEHNVVIDNVNTKMLNMAIQDETSMQSLNGHDCSQSILDNFDNQDSTKVALVQGSVYEKEIDARVQVVKNINNYFSQHTPTSISHRKLPNNQPKVVHLNGNNESGQPIQPSALNNKNKQVRRKKVANKKHDTVTRKRNSKAVDNGQMNIKKSNATSHEKHNATKTVKKIKNRRNKKKACEIYNDNVENDLSWVENIRFVREISPEEHDPSMSLLPDQFWDNFTLPDKWNDLDFEY